MAGPLRGLAGAAELTTSGERGRPEPETAVAGSGRRMAYERSGGVRAVSTHPRRTRIIVVLAVLALAGGALALFTGSSGPKSPLDSAAARSAEGVVNEADNLLANLGAPAPPGTSSAEWSVTASPVVLRHGALELRSSERPWLSATGLPLPLSAVQVATIAAEQGSLLDQLFAGPMLRDEQGELSGILAGERRQLPVPSSPGGTTVIKWFTPVISGSTARVEAQVIEWEQHDELSGTATGAVLHRSVTSGELDVTGRLVRVGGSWKITELDQSPYQQAT